MEASSKTSVKPDTAPEPLYDISSRPLPDGLTRSTPISWLMVCVKPFKVTVTLDTTAAEPLYVTDIRDTLGARPAALMVEG